MALTNEQKHVLDSLARRYQKDLYRLALWLCHDAQDASDLVQETMERACRYPPTDGNPRAWATTTLYHCFVDLFRRRKRAPQFELIENAHGVPADKDPPLLPVWEGIGMRDIRGALSHIGEVFQRVYVLVDMEERSYKEAADTLQVSIGTVATRLMRARRKLRKLLEQPRRAA